MESAARELVDGAEVEVVELEELAHPRLVKEPVSGDGPLDRPEREPEDDPDREDGEANPARVLLGRRRLPAAAADGDDHRGEQADRGHQ